MNIRMPRYSERNNRTTISSLIAQNRAHTEEIDLLEETIDQMLAAIAEGKVVELTDRDGQVHKIRKAGR